MVQARNRKVADWLARIRSGQVQLPRFQRFEAWGYGQVAGLLESVVNELPVGAVTVLEVGDRAPFQYRPIAGAPEPTERLNELLLDGQQRLTALWRALTGNYDERSYYLRLGVPTEYGGYAVVAMKRTERDGRRYPMWLDDPVECLGRDYIPATLLSPESSGAELRNWLKLATAGDSEKMIELLQELTEVRSRITAYNLPFVSLPIETTKPVVLEVFTKINTGSTPLSAFDIITTDIEESVGASLHDLLDALMGSVPGLQRYGDVQDIVLRTTALMQDRTPDRPSILDLDWARMVDDWELMVRGAERAVEFLEQERLFDAARLPVITPVPALITLWSRTERLSPDAIGAARTNLRRYIWRGIFTDRYESSAHTFVIRDVRELSEVLAGIRDVDDVEIFRLRLPTDDDLKSAGWPKKRDRLARGILAVSLYGGAVDLADGSPVTATSLGRREYHHLFPDGYLRRSSANLPPALALNCALITWTTNRTISDKEPLQYIKERTAASSLGDEEILYRLKSHAIPPDALTSNDYGRFITERCEMVEDAIQALTAGRPWSP